ncbi:MAG: glycosyltransferase family 9 protein, partial [Cyanobacteria bacterium Co-bin13]|nr:glycosyltransferase family 9 protein [Cyanobacteria bacterium Co-bin13]
MQRILFIELLGGLGDTLIALPAMQALAASHPQAQLSVLTFEPGGELLRCHPLIHEVIQIPKGTARQSVKQHLAQASYDLIVTDVSYEGIADLVRQSGAGRVVTNLWRNPPGDQLVCDRFLQILTCENLIDEATAHHYRYPQIHLTQSELTQAQNQLGATYRPLICLYPDAGMSIKHWSVDHFITLGQALQNRYSASLIIPEGSNPDQVKAITRALPNARPWPRGSLRQLAALFAQADCVVAGDTGPARIAAALGTPTITLFGPSWQDRYGQPAPHINLQGYPDCP